MKKFKIITLGVLISSILVGCSVKESNINDKEKVVQEGNNPKFKNGLGLDIAFEDAGGFSHSGKKEITTEKKIIELDKRKVTKSEFSTGININNKK